jgi:RHS repeat-associated protein
MASRLPEGRTAALEYRFDWLGNMTEWPDDAGAFYERSLGADGQLLNGFELGPQGRPGALYFSSNIRSASGDVDPALDRGGWLSVDYGEGGNAVAFTVHAQCHDAAAACYDEGGSFTTREDHLRSSCACKVEQHYQYRYDELNRLTEARRYDRDGVAAGAAVAARTWKLAARQRYGYDASNTRRVKETVQTDPADPPEAIALYVLPGDLERRGLVRSPDGLSYQADATLGTETQYLVAGARIVWKDRALPDPSQPLDRDHRITFGAGDLLGSLSCVIDLESGELIERSTYYPNGARETQQATRNQSLQLEPMGFTGKEADEEVGLVYFGQRYLIPRIARWSTPDPLQIHAMGGGEPFNSYHYISGNLLHATDPVGLGQCIGDRCVGQQGSMSEIAADAAQEEAQTAVNLGRAAVDAETATFEANGSIRAEAANPTRTNGNALAGARRALAPLIGVGAVAEEHGEFRVNYSFFRSRVPTGSERAYRRGASAARSSRDTEAYLSVAFNLLSIAADAAVVLESALRAARSLEVATGEAPGLRALIRDEGGSADSEAFLASFRRHEAGSAEQAIASEAGGRLRRFLRNKLRRIRNQIAAGGNRGTAGAVSQADALTLGQRFVGSGFRTAGEGRVLVSADGLRQFRLPAMKRGINAVTGESFSGTGTQVNFQSRPTARGAWTSNVHLDISE